jgi:SAM-dependent methyltransferase
VARRDSYRTDNEHSPIDLAEAERRPFPFQTGSPVIVGDQLIAYGFLLKTLGLPVTSRIVEFGAGWGNLAVAFAQTGYDVTVVDVDPSFGALLRRRSTSAAPLDVVVADMLEFEPTACYDAAVFFEAFHHCADHSPCSTGCIGWSDRPASWSLRPSRCSRWRIPGGSAWMGCRSGRRAATAGSSSASIPPTSSWRCAGPAGRGSGGAAGRFRPTNIVLARPWESAH